MQTKRYLNSFLLFFTFGLLLASQPVDAQSKLSIIPGFYLNGTGFNDDVKGIGGIMGLEYMPREDHFFSIELRTKCGHYSFDDGTKWRTDNDGDPIPPIRTNARLEYSLFSPQIGLAPKLHLRFDEPFSLFLENEIAGGLMMGRFNYNQGSGVEKSFTEPVWCYNIGIGAEYKLEKLKNCTLVSSIAYSTLNFRSGIKKHQPANFQGWIPNQNAAILFSVLLKVSL